jgi:hypothetical protein
MLPRASPRADACLRCGHGVVDLDADAPPSKEVTMKTLTTLAAAAFAAALSVGAHAADSIAKIQKDQAELSYDMARKQAAADEKSAKAQCDVMAGDARSQCRRNAEAAHDKTMADAKANLDKAKADYKATK